MTRLVLSELFVANLLLFEHYLRRHRPLRPSNIGHHTPSIAFRHLLPNDFGFISAGVSNMSSYKTNVCCNLSRL